MTTAFIFPGQGSQFIGMGKNLRDNFSSAREVFECVDETLKQNLSGLMMEGEASELQLTVNTQPALMAMSIAVIEVLKKEAGFTFESNVSYMAGHSLGEYSALCADQVVSLPETAKLLRIRGQAMQEAVPKGKGKMAAVIGAEFETVQTLCEKASDESVSCMIANDNSIGQIVISGHAKAIENAVLIGKEMGIKRVLELPVSAPFHSNLMAPAVPIMQDALNDIAFSAPLVPIICNVSASEEVSRDVLKQNLIDQIVGSVRWRESIDYMVSKGVNKFIEIGAGKVLTNMIKRQHKDVQTLTISEPEDIEQFVKELV